MKFIKKEKGVIKENKFKIKNLFKNSIFTFILGIFFTSIIGVSAASLLYSSNVTYDNSSSGLSSTNLQDALDELYEQASSCPVCDNNGNCTVTCPSGATFKSTSTGYKCIPPMTTTDLIKNIVTSGDGLYVDNVTTGRYIYRGSSVDNYITFNGETWRIISVESDGTIKIIRNEQLSSTYAWDTAGTRSSSTSTYCTNASSSGCNAWAATANLVGTPSKFTQYHNLGNPTNYTDIYTGTVTGDASLNTYLNGTYYNSLSDKDKVITGTFNVSTPGNYEDTETLEVDAEQEKQYKWQGYVALMNVTELLRASTSSGCTSLKLAYSSSTKTCDDNNWLWPTFNTNNYEWTLSPHVASGRNGVWLVDSSGSVYAGTADFAYNAHGVRPVLHLSSDITLSGSGSSNNPYTIN